MTRAQFFRNKGGQSDLVGKRLQARRLLQIANVLCVVLLCIGVQMVLSRDWLNAGLVASALLFTLAGRALNQRGHVELSVAVVLVSIMSLVCVSLWFTQGLYSGAVVAFPGILIVAGMAASLRLFVGLLLVMLGVVGFLTYAAMTGLHVFTPTPLGLGRMFNLGCILVMCAVAVWLLVDDLRATLARLQQVIERAERLRRALLTWPSTMR